MSETPRSPAQVINDLTDQVRLLRQDVADLTATATARRTPPPCAPLSRRQ